MGEEPPGRPSGGDHPQVSPKVAALRVREVPFDLLVITVPLNVGAEYVGRFVLSDELNQRQRLHRQDRQRLAAIHLTGRMPHIKESR